MFSTGHAVLHDSAETFETQRLLLSASHHPDASAYTNDAGLWMRTGHQLRPLRQNVFDLWNSHELEFGVYAGLACGISLSLGLGHPRIVEVPGAARREKL